jgi:hypothetical protein
MDDLLTFQRRWERKLTHLQRTYPGRWYVPGLSDEEVRDALTLRLLEEVCRERQPGSLDGDDWPLALAQRHLRVLRRRFRLAATPMDLRQVSPAGRGPTQEEQLLDLERARCRAQAGDLAERELSHAQRRWLAAMKSAAAGDQFFAASEQLNLSAASRLLGKDRSSAQRAYRQIQRQFRRQLLRIAGAAPRRA